MNKMTKIIGVSALGLGIVVSIPVLGHGIGTAMHGHDSGAYGPGHHMMHSDGMPYEQMHSGANVEQRLGSLKESLQLTTEQQPVWEQFEQAVKTLAVSEPAGHFHWGDATGNEGGDSEAHFAQMEQHLEKMKTVFVARKALYETLTEPQKETMKGFMSGSFGHHFGPNC